MLHMGVWNEREFDRRITCMQFKRWQGYAAVRLDQKIRAREKGKEWIDSLD